LSTLTEHHFVFVVPPPQSPEDYYMIFKKQIARLPYLKGTLFSYLLLVTLDSLHHLHAALALGHSSAMHAVAIGVVLTPIALLALWLFLRLKRKFFEWIFFAIATLAVLIPGIYHGGWVHIINTLAHLRVEGESSRIEQLLPASNINYWFYEFTGAIELLLALICAYFVYKYITVRLKRQ